MKKNLVSILVVVLLFGCVAMATFASKGNGAKRADAQNATAQDGTVKICPHSGLPCEGDGDCDEDCEESCEE